MSPRTYNMEKLIPVVLEWIKMTFLIRKKASYDFWKDITAAPKFGYNKISFPKKFCHLNIKFTNPNKSNRVTEFTQTSL